MIDGGYIIVARKLFKGELMDKPGLYFKLWLWMLDSANWKDRDKFKRGQFLTTIKKMREAMSYKVGYRTKTPSIDQIRSAYEHFTKTTMITTMKTTRGMIVTILNYSLYQDPKNYEAHSEPHNEATTKPTVTPQDTEEGEERKKEERKKKEEKNKTLSASGDAVGGGEVLQIEFYTTKKKRKLTGKRLDTFNRFWKSFDYRKGKAESADAWLDIPELTDTLVNQICHAAEQEAARRPFIVASGKTPKMAQGWLSGRRWEDDLVEIGRAHV